MVGMLKGNSLGESATELLGLLGFRTHFVVMLWAAVCFRKDCINHSACVFQTKTREASAAGPIIHQISVQALELEITNKSA